MGTNLIKTINDIEHEIFYVEDIRVVFKVPSDIILPKELAGYNFDRCLKGSSNIKDLIQTRLKPFIAYLKEISNIDNISDLDIVTVITGYGDDASLTDTLNYVRKSYKSGRRDK